MKYILLFIVFVACSNSALCQVKYKGITKLPLQQTLKNINGSWNNADHTGNAAMDKLLDKLVGAYKQSLQGSKHWKERQQK